MPSTADAFIAATVWEQPDRIGLPTHQTSTALNARAENRDNGMGSYPGNRRSTDDQKGTGTADATIGLFRPGMRVRLDPGRLTNTSGYGHTPDTMAQNATHLSEAFAWEALAIAKFVPDGVEPIRYGIRAGNLACCFHDRHIQIASIAASTSTRGANPNSELISHRSKIRVAPIP